jgi:outer membrane protein TolC
MAALLFVILILLPVTTLAEPASDPMTVQAQSTRTEPLTITEVLARIELTHPLLRATGVERTQARAKILKALGAWEPKLNNITEAARYQTWNFLSYIRENTGGFNDTKLVVGHPWGFQVHGGIRNGFGDSSTQHLHAQIPDVLLFYPQQQMIFGGKAHLLRGFLINDEYAEFQKAELARPQAEVKVAQKRQDLYLAGAIQYWDWQVAVKQAEVQKQALGVAEDRFAQVQGRAKAGAVALLDAVEAEQEVQRRREVAIAAQRKVEYEQYKLSLFLWENGEPVTPLPEWAPEFTGETPLPTEEEIAAAKATAMEERPEVRELAIDIQMNNIQLKLAKNNLLPKLTVSGGPVTGGIYYFGGFAYHMGALFSMPLFNREARGEVAHADAQQERLHYELLHAEQKVSLDVDNWVSAIVRARERVRAATESYRLAKALEAGERTRFNLGATNILFVNLRERNAVEAAYDLYRAQYDYVLARGGYLWAKGALSKPVAETVLAKYGDPSMSAGSSGQKMQGRD